MNKIVVEKNKISSNFPLKIDNFNINLENNDVFIIYKDSNCNFKFNIKNDLKIYEYYTNSTCYNTYNLDNNINLTLNRFCFDCSFKTDINLSYKSNILYKYACISLNDNNYIINVYHNDKDTTSKVVNYGINFTDKKLDFLINSYVKKESINSNAIQDSKIILKRNGNSSIKPNLIIDNNEISSSHSAYIGNFKSNEIFYLQSRGISYNKAIKLLAKSFLTSNMEIDELINLILDDLDRIWGV